MVEWRKVALTMMPQCKKLIARARAPVPLWVDLQLAFADAYRHRTPKNPQLIRSIHGYAWWCIAESNNPDLASAATTCFYEHLPVTPGAWEELHLYLDRRQFEGLRDVFKYFFEPHEQQPKFDQFLVALRKREKELKRITPAKRHQKLERET